jgi:hypothetical protein
MSLMGLSVRVPEESSGTIVFAVLELPPLIGLQ